ncbi:hypothetical protein PISMIDRAFT_688397 [Pisolithus microcarpus 441]|uniref:Uncharacterized protein n=1 Tax=Pisolithus microcarpus 441 TaxID=765257 RepID=A0A0C9YU00_9AGAM|nr:hypothetical protein PISMIDRAFT_689370 [Pisolithus microcarpus 441]KIK13767.1 hypothetical protein PISMIDRAFT_688397 [Pisolithus microcarpus 441]
MDVGTVLHMLCKEEDENACMIVAVSAIACNIVNDSTRLHDVDMALRSDHEEPPCEKCTANRRYNDGASPGPPLHMAECRAGLTNLASTGEPVNWVLQRVRLLVFFTAHHLDHIVSTQQSKMDDADMNVDHALSKKPYIHTCAHAARDAPRPRRHSSRDTRTTGHSLGPSPREPLIQT